MALTDLTRISTSGIATGSTIDSPILRKDVNFRGSQVGVSSILFDSSDDKLNLKDNVKLELGNNPSDLFLLHNGTYSQIAGIGDFFIQSNSLYLKDYTNGHNYLKAVKDGAVDLYHNNDLRFSTTGYGATVFGTLNFSSGGGISAGVVTCTGLDLNGNGDISGNFVIGGDLTVNGTTTTLDTNLTEVDRIEVGANSNTVTGIAVTQSGTADIVRLYDGASQVVTVTDTGDVGIGTDNPQEILHIHENGTAPCDIRISNDEGYGFLRSDSNLLAYNAQLHLFANRDRSAEYMRIDNNGRVFIGETSVAGSAKFVVGNGGAENFEFTPGMASSYEGGVLEYIHRGDGNTRPNLNFYVNNTGAHKFWTAGSERVTIASGGNVGIGTDPSVSNGKFQVFGTSTVLARFGNTISSTYEAISIKNTVAGYPAVCNDSSSDTLDLRSMGSVQVTIDSNNNSTGKYFRVMNNAEGDAGTELFRVQDNGNVGIGEADPATLLEVSAGTNKNLNVWSSGAYATGITIGSANDAFSAYTPVEFRGSEFYFHNGTEEKLRINSSGRVGIGTDAPSSAWLDIATTIGTYDHIRMRRISSDANIASNWSLKPYGGDLYFREGGSDDKIVFTDSAKVGINNTSPQSMLDVKETSTTQSETDKRIAIFRKNGTSAGDEGYIHLTTYTGHYGVKLGYRSEGGSPGYLNQGFFISTVNSGENITNHTKKFVILSNGNIGIARTNPSYKLHIQTAPSNSTQVTGLSIANDASNSGVGAKINLGAGSAFDSTSAGISGWYDGTGTSLSLFTTASYATTGHEERLTINSSGEIKANDASFDSFIGYTVDVSVDTTNWAQNTFYRVVNDNVFDNSEDIYLVWFKWGHGGSGSPWIITGSFLFIPTGTNHTGQTSATFTPVQSTHNSTHTISFAGVAGGQVRQGLQAKADTWDPSGGTLYIKASKIGHD